MARASHLDEAQGRSEQRTELYFAYSEGVAELLTMRFAKNISPGLWLAQKAD